MLMEEVASSHQLATVHTLGSFLMSLNIGCTLLCGEPRIIIWPPYTSNDMAPVSVLVLGVKRTIYCLIWSQGILFTVEKFGST